MTKVWDKYRKKKRKKMEISWEQRKRTWHKYLKETETKADIATRKSKTNRFSGYYGSNK